MAKCKLCETEMSTGRLFSPEEFLQKFPDDPQHRFLHVLHFCAQDFCNNPLLVGGRKKPCWWICTRCANENTLTKEASMTNPRQKLWAAIEGYWGTDSLDTAAMKAIQKLQGERSLEAAELFRLIAAVTPSSLSGSNRIMELLHKVVIEPDSALQLPLVRALGMIGSKKSLPFIEEVLRVYSLPGRSEVLRKATEEAIHVIQGQIKEADTEFINPDNQ